MDRTSQGAFAGRTIGKEGIKNFFSRKEQLSTSTTTLSERCMYPILAVKKRILNFAVLGATVAGLLSISLPAFIGSGIGASIGGAVKLAKMMMGQDSRAVSIGAVIGGMTGAFLGAIASAPMILFAITAFSVIGLVKSVIKLPVDIYYANTLNDEDLNDYFNEHIDGVEDLLAEPIWEELEELKKAIAASDKGSDWFKIIARRYGIHIQDEET